MRADNLNDGTVKALLIIALLAANIALAVYSPSPATREGNNLAPTPPRESYVARP